MKWFGRGVAVLIVIGLTGSALPARVVAAPSPCGENLSTLLGAGIGRSLSPGIALTVWSAARPSTELAQRNVRAALLHSTTASVTPVLSPLPQRVDPAELVARTGLIAAVNGDLFDAIAVDASVPEGPVVTNGVVRYAPPGRHAVVHWSNGRPRLHRALLRASVTIATAEGAVLIPIAAVNYPDLSTGSVLFTQSWSGRTVRGSTTLVLRSGRLTQIIRGGRAVSPQRGESVVQILDAPSIPAGLHVGATARVRSVLGRTHADTKVMGHSGRLLRDGELTRPCDGVAGLLRPRTAFAWNDTGESWLAVISSGQPDAADGMRGGGATVSAFGSWLASQGATDAVLLDGGGSTIMLRGDRPDVLRIGLPQSTYRRPVPVLLGVVPISRAQMLMPRGNAR